ncbi:hypothetical protein [Ohessyouella blattaphilus]|uniref:Uncharacterized protein n=1 Tax=Ohessyouella blattaphilus TaxID=2949333 RepID=A0ABT1EHZ4_9FIRM|nr:hypothetical protein [Ohessyouella blattaphilus]MCP1110325.1 hypothetical protein [Ohessyouella blattaphilus]MCR8563719.1 hypothetical protein [Ohessyouella blattaphilus]
MKSFKEVTTAIAESRTQRAQEIKEWRIKLEEARQDIEKANSLLEAGANGSVEDYQRAKDKLGEANTLEEFCTKRIAHLESEPLMAEEKAQEASIIIKAYLEEENRKQYQEAAKLMEKLEEIANGSNALDTECSELMKTIGYAMPRLDYVRGFFAQVADTPMYDIITKRGER